MGYGPQAGYGPRPGSSAGWALGLTILGAVMLIGVGMAWAVFVSQAAQAALGASPTQEQIQKFAEDSMRQGNFPHRQGLAMAAVAAMLASIGGLVLAVRSLVRQESGRGMAITACVLGGIFLFCQVMMMMMFLAARSAT
jgi:hypothetical protein